MERIIRFFMRTHVLIALSIVLIILLAAIRIKQVVMENQLAPADRFALQQAPTPEAFNINGTYECSVASKSATLHKKQLAIMSTTATSSARTLFKGDCLYQWETIKGKAKTGQKSCGLGQYVGILEMLVKIGKITPETLSSSLVSTDIVDSIIPASESALIKDTMASSQELLQSCRPASAVDTSLFELPAGIRFTEVPKK